MVEQQLWYLYKSGMEFLSENHESRQDPLSKLFAFEILCKLVLPDQLGNVHTTNVNCILPVNEYYGIYFVRLWVISYTIFHQEIIQKASSYRRCMKS